MARDRNKNRAKVRIEKVLDWKNTYDAADPVPRLAVAEIIKQQKQNASQAIYRPVSQPGGGA